jgi:acetyl esterase/lipase
VLLGGAERLYDEGVSLVEKARHVAVHAELEVADDMPHNPPMVADFHRAADEAFTRAARRIVQCLEARAPQPISSPTERRA